MDLEVSEVRHCGSVCSHCISCPMHDLPSVKRLISSKDCRQQLEVQGQSGSVYHACCTAPVMT